MFNGCSTEVEVNTMQVIEKTWCRGPGTNGSRHPLHHQGRGINPSGAMSCALALCKPSSNQQGRPTSVSLRVRRHRVQSATHFRSCR